MPDRRTDPRAYLARAWRGLFRDPGTKGMALLLAATAWLWVQSQTLTVRSVRVDLDVVTPESLVAVGELPTAVTAVVEGTRTALRRAARGDRVLTVDLSDAVEGPQELQLDAFEVAGLSGAVRVVRIQPEALRVRLDARATRAASVRPILLGEVSPTVEVASSTVRPDVVELSGPRSVLSQLDVVRTAPIDVSGISEDTRRPASLELPRGVRVVGDWGGEVEIELTKVRGEKTLSGVPVSIVARDGGPWSADAASRQLTVVVAGPTKVLRDLRPDQVYGVVHLPPAPDGDVLVATYQAARAPRLEIVLPWPDQLEVVGTPGPVTVVR